MNDWKSKLKADQTAWLLEDDNPSVRYFTLVDLLEKAENDLEVIKTKEEIMQKGVVPVQAEHLSFPTSCHSVEDAARSAHTSAEDLVKNICLIDDQENLIVAIVKGEDRVSLKKIGEVLGIEPPRPANPQEILEKTSYICGGVSSFGYSATFLIDPKVMEKEMVYFGGGSEKSIICQ